MCSGLWKKIFFFTSSSNLYIFADLSKAYFYFCWCERESRTSNGCFPADAELQTELCYNASLGQYRKAWDGQSKTSPSQQPTCIFCYLISVLTRLSQQCAHENQVINGPNFDNFSDNNNLIPVMYLIEKGTNNCCRSMQARKAMRVLPRMSFGLEYSKGMKWAQYSGWYVEHTAGIEWRFQ